MKKIIIGLVYLFFLYATFFPLGVNGEKFIFNLYSIIIIVIIFLLPLPALAIYEYYEKKYSDNELRKWGGILVYWLPIGFFIFILYALLGFFFTDWHF